MGDKMTIPTASWIASGQYHHHLAFNHWAGPNLKAHPVGIPGLNFITIEFSDSILFSASLKKASLYGLPIVEKSENQFTLQDSDGIVTKVILVSKA